MTQMRTAKRQWIRGALLVATMAACQSGDPNEPKDTKGNEDVVEALAALPEAEMLASSADGVAQIVQGDLGRVEASHQDSLLGSDASLREALPPILKAFRLENKDLKLRKVNVDEVGGRHYRYDQVFNGLPVVGGDLVVHVDVKGAITGINGTARGDISPSLGGKAVSVGAANASIENDSRWAGMTGRTIKESRTVYIQTQAGTLHKAYEQIVEGQRGQDPVIDKVYVDVETGLVLEHHPQIQHARNRNTYSANNGSSLPGTLKRTETQAPTTDVDVNAAHDGAGHTYDLYAAMWNRDGIDNAGMNMISTVHYQTNYCNAFWNNTQMAYGDGNSSQNCGPLARSIDVAAHEMTHGVTSRESNLTYSGESGGLNESLSDIWGAGVEAWVDAGKLSPPTFSLANDVFLIGDTVLPPFLRSMCDPVADGVSKDAWYSGLGSIDVHYSSGPNNLVFCLMSKGGTHPRNATTINVPAIGMEKALRLMYKVNVDLATSSTNYATWRNLMVQAAQQLGYDQATQDAVACAYAAIKVGTAPTSCGGSPPPPPPPTVVLTNGVAVTGIADSTAGTFKFFSLDVPAGQSTVKFEMTGGTGDADLYVKFGTAPTDTVYDCRPYLSGNTETCSFTPPSTGTYIVGIRTYAAYSGVSLKGTFSGTAPSGCGTNNDPVLANGVGQLISGASSTNTYRCINDVPAGRTLTVKISGGTGDADLYTQFNARPTTSSYLCRPYLSGNTETCTHSTTTLGDWTVMVRAFSAYSGTTVIASY
jgi:vibriolysin